LVFETVELTVEGCGVVVVVVVMAVGLVAVKVVV
jgi:hypothetical protein